MTENEEGIENEDGEEVNDKQPVCEEMNGSSFDFEVIKDYEKFAKGMDDLGDSDSDDDDDEEDEHEDVEKDNASMVTFSKVKVAEEVEKGKSVRNQIGTLISFFILLMI